MLTKEDLADAYLTEIENFELRPTSSHMVLESARRFLLDHMGVAISDTLRPKRDKIHELLEALLIRAVRTPGLKPGLYELARKYLDENTSVQDRLDIHQPKIDPARLEASPVLELPSWDELTLERHGTDPIQPTDRDGDAGGRQSTDETHLPSPRPTLHRPRKAASLRTGENPQS